MDDREGSFVAVRRISQGLERGSVYNPSSAEAVPGSAAWLGRGLSCVCAQRRDSDAHSTFDLTPAQEESLQSLQNRIDVAYDSTIPLHQEALRELWKLAFPEEELHGLISEQWKEMGWQGKDPSTDFRGGGFISLENLLYFARNFQKSFQDLLRKQVGDRSVWEYPFAVAGVNLTFMLIQMLDLEAVKPRTIVGATFLKFLSENESAFDLLYCIAFKLMDQQWLSMRASYMEFNTVMKSTRRQLERELMLEDITHLEDLPSMQSSKYKGSEMQDKTLRETESLASGLKNKTLSKTESSRAKQNDAVLRLGQNKPIREKEEIRRATAISSKVEKDKGKVAEEKRKEEKTARRTSSQSSSSNRFAVLESMGEGNLDV